MYSLEFHRVLCTESTPFNSRLEPTQIVLGVTPGATNLLDLDYTNGTTSNNGNVLSDTFTPPIRQWNIDELFVNPVSGLKRMVTRR